MKLTSNYWKSVFLGAGFAAFLFSNCAEKPSGERAVDYKHKASLITLANDNAKVYVSQRPELSSRLFKSHAVEEKISEVVKLLSNAKLRWMFENCFPNTIDTTVRYYTTEDGDDDTLVYTGDIHAMWLRDSGAQVWPYIQLANKDEALKKMIRGTILRQFRSINIDPYANAFLDPHDPDPDHQWMSDMTDMKPELHERKWEIDSLCYPIRLAYAYWKETGDASIFQDEWVLALNNILATFTEQQKKEGHGSYTFQRKTERHL